MQSACIEEANYFMNDFRLVSNGNHRFTVEDSMAMHKESVNWLQMKLMHQKFLGKTVVITHHAPSYASVVPRFAKDLISASFASNLDYLLDFLNLWIHGHMHDSLDYMVNKCRVICNPRGYTRYSGGQENPQFNPSLIIEI
jgi:calcineurin-like phosphoesterase family protein